jgi:hypothetical protein
MRVLVACLLVLSLNGTLHAEDLPKEIILYDFEQDTQGWEVPDWALSKKDHVGEEVGLSELYTSHGKRSLEFKVNFPGAKEWRGAYVECPVDIQDWSPYGSLEVDVLLPEGAPRGLRAKVILTVSEDWKWTEMNKAVKLEPGEWTVLKANLKPGSLNWKSFITDEFRQDVKKIGVRIESNNAITYKGSAYIDNVKLSQE